MTKRILYTFCDGILNDYPTRVRDVKILMTIYESARKGEAVSFDWLGDTPLDLV